jgi:hypothetical protein
LEEVLDFVREVFRDRKGRGGLNLLSDVSAEGADVLLDGTLFWVPVTTLDDRDAALHLFVNPGVLGTALWNQELQTLIRFNAQRHPALPRILRGASRRTPGRGGQIKDFAFSLTDLWPDTLCTPGVFEVLQAQRSNSLRQLGMLAEGLSLLAADGFLHRNLWEKTIQVRTNETTELLELRLSRFEMSLWQANLLRRSTMQDRGGAREAVARYVGQGRSALACSPRERLDTLFGHPARDPEEPRGDVYSLGVLAFQWFIEPLDGDLLRRAFPEQAPGAPLPYGYDQAAWSELHGWMWRRIQQCSSAQLPAPLRQLLEGMLPERPRNRLLASEVAAHVGANYEAIIAGFGYTQPTRPYMVSIIRREWDKTALPWGWIGRSGEDPVGFTELKTFIERDLRGASFEFFPGGYAEVSGETSLAAKAAQYVAIGHQGIYFGQPHKQHAGYGSSRSERVVPEVLILKYVLNIARDGHKYPRSPVRRALPPIEVVSSDAAVLRRDLGAYPKWDPLLVDVRQRPATLTNQQTFQDALDFFLQLRETELDCRQYAFKCEQGEGEFATLAFDEVRDAARLRRSAVASLVANSERRRPRFGDFFGALAESEEGLIMRWRLDVDGAPERKPTTQGTVSVEGRLGPQRIRVMVKGGNPVLPGEGWLEPEADNGERVSLRRQQEAKAVLTERAGLISSLLDPAVLADRSGRWRGVAGEIMGRSRRRYRKLRGIAPQVLRDLLDSEPIYALQGPPGTGKTTIAARAVRALLRTHPAARILVSSQSHYALDNLAEKVYEYISDEPKVDVIRIASEQTTDRVGTEVRHLLPEVLAPKEIDSIRDECARNARRGRRELLANWIAVLTSDAGRMEFEDRLRWSASVVFATCAMCHERQLGVTGAVQPFDWIIIEEAAKAWPTELMMPLTLGTRWTLIGDHYQLPAYRRDEVKRILDECEASWEDELKTHGKQKKRYMAVFELFRSFFENEDQQPIPPPPEDDGALRRPVDQLDTQFRMPRVIGDLISGVFYRGKLDTDPDADLESHGLVSPPEFRGQKLVWIDTSEEVDCRERPRWYNRGEAEVVAAVLEKLRPHPLRSLGSPLRKPDESIAILTPYKAQRSTIKSVLKRHELEEYADYIRTVDSVQGREAEIVIVSLVRGGGGHIGSNPLDALGYLLSTERVNVMFSRAKRLLVIVGNLRHFEAAVSREHEHGTDPAFTHGDGIEAWRKICRYVREHADLPNSPARLLDPRAVRTPAQPQDAVPVEINE